MINFETHSETQRLTHLKVTPNQDKERPEFCVSDIEGLSCTKDYIDGTCKELNEFSSSVTQNKPYFGGHITRHINATFQRINNIQIEINRSIYMDEDLRVLKEILVNELKPNLTRALLKVYKSNQ